MSDKFQVIGRRTEKETEPMEQVSYDEYDKPFTERWMEERDVEILQLKCTKCGAEFDHPSEVPFAYCSKCGNTDDPALTERLLQRPVKPRFSEGTLKCCGCPSTHDKQCEDCDCHIDAYMEDKAELANARNRSDIEPNF